MSSDSGMRSELGGSGDERATDSSMGSGIGADVGQSSPSPGAPSTSPGSDPGSGMGGDEAFDNRGGPPLDPVSGIAGRAAEEDSSAEDDDNPALVEGEGSSGTTSGYTL